MRIGSWFSAVVAKAATSVNPGLRIFYGDYGLYNNNFKSFQVLYRHTRLQALLKGSHKASCNL